MPADPFFEYVQFDGASHPGAPAKRINIFLAMSQGDANMARMIVLCHGLIKKRLR